MRPWETDHMRNSGRPRQWEAVGGRIWEAEVGGRSGSQSESQNSASHQYERPICEADLRFHQKI